MFSPMESPGAMPPPHCNVPPQPIPIMTPATNAQVFQPSTLPRQNDRPGVIGKNVEGVKWMTRILMSLRSGIDKDVRWAISALTEVSFRSPDSLKDKRHVEALHLVLLYVFDQFSAATIAQTDLDLSYEELERLQGISEALLVLRNVCLDAETAQRLGSDPVCRKVLDFGLALPAAPCYREALSLLLEIAEYVCFYIVPEGPDCRLFQSFMGLLDSQDRFQLICVLRSLSRLCVYDEKSCILALPVSRIHVIMRYLMVDDTELISAALDLLYQYTARLQSVDELIRAHGDDVEALDTPVYVEASIRELLSTHLVRLLTYKMDREKLEYIRLPPRTKRPVPAEPPRLPEAILNELLAISEPGRATNWIRASYEPDPDAEVTQVSLWSAYQSQFEPHARKGREPLLRAVDFIRNVTSAFRNASAMVVQLPNGEKKFVIKGLKPRETAVSPSIYANNSSMLPDTRRRVPPPFGPTAALVLQNVARLQGGRVLIRPHIAAIVDAALINPMLLPYVDSLLAMLDQPSSV